MPSENQFAVLEKKITQALQKLSELKEKNSDLQAKLEEARAANKRLSKQVADLGKGAPKGRGPDLDRIKGQVDALLAKFEELEL